MPVQPNTSAKTASGEGLDPLGQGIPSVNTPKTTPTKQAWTPGDWYVLEVMGRSFVAAKPYEGHPYFNRTRHMDIAGDEDYPTKQADLKLIAKAPEMVDMLATLLRCTILGAHRDTIERILREAGAL